MTATPTPAASPVDSPATVTWRPRGDWTFSTNAPLSVAVDTTGTPTLTVRLVADRPLAVEAAAAVQAAADRIRAAALDAVAASPAFARLVAVRCQLKAVREALAAADSRKRVIQRERSELSGTFPVVPGLGAKLAEKTKELNGATAEVQSRADELEALLPVYRAAVAAVEALIAGLCAPERRAEAHRAAQAAVEERLTALADRVADALSELFLLARVAAGVPRLDPVELARMVVGNDEAAANTKG